MTLKVTRAEFLGIDRMDEDELRDNVLDLLAENTKLRELVRDMWEYVKGYADSLDAELHGYSWPANARGYGDKVRNGLGEFVGFPDRIRELGMEVDE